MYLFIYEYSCTCVPTKCNRVDDGMFTYIINGISSLFCHHVVLLYAMMSSSYREEHNARLPKPVLVTPAPFICTSITTNSYTE